MSEDLHSIDDLFRSGLEGKEESPAPVVWDRIEQELDKKERKPAAGFFRNYGKVAAILMVVLGSAALFAAGYYLRGIHMSRQEKKELPVIRLQPGEKQNNASDSSNIDIETPVSESEQPEAVNEEQKNTQEGTTAPIVPDLAHQENNTTAPAPGSREKMKEGAVVEEENYTTRTAPPASKETDHAAPASPNKAPVITASVTAQKNANANKRAKTKTGQRSTNNPQQYPDAVAKKEPANIADGLQATEAQQNTEALPPMIHEAETAPVVPAAHDLPVAEKKISASSASSGLNKQVASAPAAAIPVLNKHKGTLNIPKLSITPVVSSHSVSNKIKDNGTWQGEELREDIERTEHLPARIGGGLLIDLRISRNMTIQSGLLLNQNDIHIDPKSVRAVKTADGKVKYQFDCSAGTYYMNPKQGSYPRPGDTAMTRYSTNSLNYLNIPISLKWHFGSSKLQFFATAGAGLNLLTGQELEASLQHQYRYEESYATNLKSNYFNGMIGAGMNWSFTKKVALNLSPQYQFALSPINENMPVKAYPRSFNVQMGLQITLK